MLSNHYSGSNFISPTLTNNKISHEIDVYVYSNNCVSIPIFFKNKKPYTSCTPKQLMTLVCSMTSTVDDVGADDLKKHYTTDLLAFVVPMPTLTI
jgi:hypothetical protein